jgi:UDP-glucose 4-epimerase
MRKALVTGAAGSVGREVVATLVQRGWSVRACDLPQCDFSAFEGQSQVEVVRGSITDAASTTAACAGVDVVMHLAALLPPVSERNRNLTMSVNVEGTRNIVEGIKAGGNKALLVFSSSVVTYGDTSANTPPVTVDTPQHPQEVYAESKLAAEQLILASDVSYAIIRISGVSIPALLDPPDVWPFSAEQRMEFVNRADVMSALCNSVDLPRDKWNQVYLVAGGETWRMRGRDYVGALCEVMELPPEGMKYKASAGWFDWYDTTASQAALRYQNTPFPEFIVQLRAAVEEAYA